MIKKALRLLITILIAINVLGVAATVAADIKLTAPVITQESQQRKNITMTTTKYSEWIYYQKEGKLWKQLWSNTEATWLTDLIFVRDI